MTTADSMNTRNAAISAISAPTRFVNAKDRTLAYRSVGSGPVIILCNRFRGTLDTWDPAFVDALARTFTVITFDYSGVGRSTGAPPATVAALAQDAKDLADALGIAKFVIGGWSMGGIAATAFVAKWPEAITHVISIGSNPPGPNERHFESLFLEIAAKPELSLEDEIAVFFEPRSEASRLAAKQSVDRIAARTTDLDPPVPAHVFGPLLRNIATDAAADPDHVRDALKATALPLLVLSGDRDIVLPVENWYAISGELPTAQHVVFPRAGHGPQHQYPEIAAAYINAFVHTTG